VPLVQNRWECEPDLSRSQRIAAQGVPENLFAETGRNPRPSAAGRRWICCTGKGLILGTVSESGPSGPICEVETMGQRAQWGKPDCPGACAAGANARIPRPPAARPRTFRVTRARFGVRTPCEPACEPSSGRELSCDRVRAGPGRAGTGQGRAPAPRPASGTCRRAGPRRLAAGGWHLAPRHRPGVWDRAVDRAGHPGGAGQPRGRGSRRGGVSWAA
jgi:hypothetical protein